MDPNNISRLEFYGMMVGVFSFIFAVHMSTKIHFQWFHGYVTLLIVGVQLVCFFYFMKYFKKK